MERVQNSIFFTVIFLKLDNSINIEHRLFKFCEVIFYIIMEGTCLIFLI